MVINVSALSTTATLQVKRRRSLLLPNHQIYQKSVTRFSNKQIKLFTVECFFKTLKNCQRAIVKKENQHQLCFALLALQNIRNYRKLSQTGNNSN